MVLLQVINKFGYINEKLFLHSLCFLSELLLLSGVPDYFDRNKISSGGDLSHYSSASLY